ncbi:MAG TPA: hypothetical protein VMG36_00980 [Thermoplasmata archaeon]|nr:hypothetical protein [Thermoplasmata archaeon]
MIAGQCDRCGGPFASGQRRCDWCGSYLGGAPPPLPAPAAIRPVDLPMFGGHWRGSLVVVVCTVTFLVVVFVAVIALGPVGLSPPVGLNAVHVTGVVASSPDNACGLNGTEEAPFVANGSSFYPLEWVVPANGSTDLPCTITNISTSTPGFTVVATLPMTATSPDTILSFDVYTPLAYTGPLALTFR